MAILHHQHTCITQRGWCGAKLQTGHNIASENRCILGVDGTEIFSLEKQCLSCTGLEGTPHIDPGIRAKNNAFWIYQVEIGGTVGPDQAVDTGLA